MNVRIAAYEKRLREAGAGLERLETAGRVGAYYQKMLRKWLALVAAYEYECEMIEAGTELAAVV
jgi:hypothetical protein